MEILLNIDNIFIHVHGSLGGNGAHVKPLHISNNFFFCFFFVWASMVRRKYETEGATSVQNTRSSKLNKGQATNTKGAMLNEAYNRGERFVVV